MGDGRLLVPTEHRDVSVAKIAARATIIASVIGAAASVAVAWISARGVAPGAVQQAIDDQGANIAKLEASATNSEERLGEVLSKIEEVELRTKTAEKLASRFGDLGNVADCRMTDPEVEFPVRKATPINFLT